MFRICLLYTSNIPPYDAEKLMLSMQDMTVNYASSSRLVRARLSLELKNIFLSLVELDSAVTGRGNDGIVNRITSLVKSTAFDLSLIHIWRTF